MDSRALYAFQESEMFFSETREGAEDLWGFPGFL